ncbi:MAG: hypothetical protein ANABAC_2753 [Anaerolineae bacterium]|nr:MAG: hypothetical protein ANABAC_2753 [Anaerolineae bacterium]
MTWKCKVKCRQDWNSLLKPANLNQAVSGKKHSIHFAEKVVKNLSSKEFIFKNEMV